jgi:hypothetical protein
MLLTWCCLASSASRIWLPAKLKLRALAEAWKVKQGKALVIQAFILRACARQYLRQVVVLDKFGPTLILRAKIARKRVAARMVHTFILECKSVYAAVKSVKIFRAKFSAARKMVLRHLETKYQRVGWLAVLWNKLERNRLLASRCSVDSHTPNPPPPFTIEPTSSSTSPWQMQRRAATKWRVIDIFDMQARSH